MGAATVTCAVCDAGPLIHLDEIGVLSLLGTFERLYVPDAVWRETVIAGRVDRLRATSLRNLQRVSVSAEELQDFINQYRLRDLQAGERECLYLCRHLPCNLVLTDDLAVRERAQQIGITPVGSLGVVIRAARLGTISVNEAEECLYALYDVSSLFVSKAIVDMAVHELRSALC